MVDFALYFVLGAALFFAALDLIPLVFFGRWPADTPGDG